MELFKKKYRVNTVPYYQIGDTEIEVKYMPQVKAWYKFKWLDMIDDTLNSETQAWEFIEMAKKFPKPIYKPN